MSYLVPQYREMMKMSVANWVTEDSYRMDEAIVKLQAIVEGPGGVPEEILNYWNVFDDYDKAAVFNRITFDVMSKIPEVPQ